MTFALIPGAGCTPYHWHPLTAELRDRGHTVIEVELPCDDDTAGLSAYCDAIVGAVGGHERVTLVAHSLGGMTAPVVCDRLDVELLVLVAAVVPAPGESATQWWVNTAYPSVEDESVDTFFADLPADLAAEATRQLRPQSGRPMDDPSPMTAWPDVPTRAVIATNDLLFPADFLRRVTRERLGAEPDETPGGHFPMLGHPVELADRLEAYRHEVRQRG
ncbi:alpha/beta hydrolase family protein [Kribbella amoyensis]|uniref:Alpha/beta hydrolase family protein n=1 Tax=Kribbella amoyensis TaxID=996641 RepID=A0A561BP06_9ACTN|nr:alpha/beta hydrolase [Kribbella amoyensis]TWD80543.1 alpha/beta hydrolase family protein [Kribbella amoyensis]